MQNRVLLGVFWKLLERFGVQGVQFVLQIILARLLTPEHYGVLSIMIIFINLANVFIQNGFNTALIQNKNVTEEDYSSVFWVSLLIALGLYVLFFISAPKIAIFYNMPDFVIPFRVLALMLIPGTYNSVQVAKLSREMNFKEVFRSNVIAILISGIVGIVLAYVGAGLWALVVQTMLNVVISCIVMIFTSRWHLKFICDCHRIKILFSFGWKLLVSSLLDTLYQDLRSLVIGRKYDSITLAYYNRGKQFPQFIISAINGTVQSVMLPVMSEKQDDRIQVKCLMRSSITLSSYIIFPLMAGLAAIAEHLVIIMLTEKWVTCVPYMQVYCFVLAFYPVHSCNLQTINAMGRSDVFLKLEFIKKMYGLAILAIAVFCFETPLAIAMSGLAVTWIGWFVNAYPNKRLISYSYIEQIIDVFPNLVLSLIMFICVWQIGKIDMNPLGVLIIQIIAGGAIYLVLSVIIKPRAYILLVEKLKVWIKIIRDRWHKG